VSVDAGAVFKGLTIAKLPDGSPLLYATDFHNAKVDVFDGSFGGLAGDLLVGNFGNGAINAYTTASGEWEYDGALRNAEGKDLTIDGLWALQFGNAGNNGNRDTLFFTAGPDDESHGLFGTILPS
jgi:hypothetical protein